MSGDYATGRGDRNLKWGERCATRQSQIPEQRPKQHRDLDRRDDRQGDDHLDVQADGGMLVDVLGHFANSMRYTKVDVIASALMRRQCALLAGAAGA